MSCGKGDDIRRYVRHAFLFVAIYFHTHTHKYPDVNIWHLDIVFTPDRHCRTPWRSSVYVMQWHTPTIFDVVKEQSMSPAQYYTINNQSDVHVCPQCMDHTLWVMNTATHRHRKMMATNRITWHIDVHPITESCNVSTPQYPNSAISRTHNNKWMYDNETLM